MERGSMGNRVAQAHERYWVVKTIRIVEDLGFKNRFEGRMTGSDQPTTNQDTL